MLRLLPYPASLLVCLALALTATAAVTAQAMPVQPGERVRLTLTGQERSIEGYVPAQQLRGGVLSVSRDSIVLSLHPALGPTPVALAAIASLERSRGVEQWWEGAWRQGQGVATTLAIQFFFYEWIAKHGFFSNPFEAAAVGAGAGMIGGGIWGALRPQEKWEPLSWPPPARAGNGGRQP